MLLHKALSQIAQSHNKQELQLNFLISLWSEKQAAEKQGEKQSENKVKTKWKQSEKQSDKQGWKQLKTRFIRIWVLVRSLHLSRFLYSIYIHRSITSTSRTLCTILTELLLMV